MSTVQNPDAGELMDVEDGRILVPFDDPKLAPATIHNFQGSAQEVWEKVSFARSVSCRPGNELINNVFPLSYWLCHEAYVNKETGRQQCVRTVLMDATGTCYGFMSNGVYDSLRDLVQALGPGPYDPPINITVRSKDKEGGRRVYTIEPAPRRSEEPPK